MRTVKMRHKALKEAAIDVPESAVRHHERAGWARVEAPVDAGDDRAVTQPAPQQTPPALAGGSSTPTARRQPTTERSAD